MLIEGEGILKGGKICNFLTFNVTLDCYFDITMLSQIMQKNLLLILNLMLQIKAKATLDVKLENDEFVTETDSEDEENDDAQIRNFNEENNGRFLFIYQWDYYKI